MTTVTSRQTLVVTEVAKLEVTEIVDALGTRRATSKSGSANIELRPTR
jgi:hypothetical protein